jgi:serine/threonine-protein kinase
MAFAPGETIAGRYVVEREIASGGMGVIYAAKHRLLDEHVAIKCLLPELAKDGEQAARLIREARSAAKIKSEHVARVQDADVLPDGTVFLVMEQLEGTDLAALVEGRGFTGIPIADASMYVLQACEALAEAHALGIVHRDLKPANLFLTRTPEGSPVIKVLDFGIAKGLEGNDAIVHTQTGSFLGTPLYASPEQIDTPHDVDVRTDVWALGCVLYELVAGVPPFSGDSIASIVNAIVHKDPSPALQRRLDVPPEFEAIVFRALA